MVKYEETLPNQITELHPILTDSGKGQFTLGIIGSSSDVTYTSPLSFSSGADIPFQFICKNSVKFQINILTQQNPIMEDIDLYVDYAGIN